MVFSGSECFLLFGPRCEPNLDIYRRNALAGPISWSEEIGPFSVQFDVKLSFLRNPRLFLDGK